MPNWTQNTLTVTGSPEAVAAFRQKARGVDADFKDGAHAEPSTVVRIVDLSFHALHPVPAALLARTFGAEDESKAGTATLVDGHESGHAWQYHNWGTKWGATDVSLDASDPGRLVYDFQTAWSPPRDWLLHVSDLFPSLVFVDMWRDEYDGYRTLHGDVYAAGRSSSVSPRNHEVWRQPPGPESDESDESDEAEA